MRTPRTGLTLRRPCCEDQARQDHVRRVRQVRRARSDRVLAGRVGLRVPGHQPGRAGRPRARGAQRAPGLPGGSDHRAPGMTVARALMLGWSSPSSPGQAGEFEDWYENTHIPQIRAAVPSITAVSRYQLVDPESPGRPDRYGAVNERDPDATPAAAAALADSAAAGRLDMTTAMNMADHPPDAQWYQEVPR